MASTDLRLDPVEVWHAEHADFGAQLRRSLHVAEGDDEDVEPRDVDERLVQCIWSDQLLNADALQTASGKRLEVVDPGRWNTGRGPDFLGAKFRLAGREYSGDVEIHLQSKGWTQHGHHQDYEYNNVQLHVCLRASDDRPYEEKQNGERLERAVIEHALDPDLETIRRTINVSDYPYGKPADAGVCHDQFAALNPARLDRFLRAAGRARIEEKIARFKMQRASASFDQLLYQSLMVGQGFKANKTLYFLLSKRVPIDELVDYGHDVDPAERTALYHAILMNVAQLMPAQAELFDDADEETAAFLAQQQRLWRGVRGYFSDRLMPPTRRWFAGMRPPGFPGRRLAGVSVLLDRMSRREAPLFPAFRRRVEVLEPGAMSPRDWKDFLRESTELLIVEQTGNYFETHFTVGGKACKAQALLGEPAARTLLFNVLLPLVVLSAREEKNRKLEANAWAVIESFPALPKNSVTSFMKRRLLGPEEKAAAVSFRSELTNQALMKVFQDCCAMNEQTCGQCTFLNPPFRLG